MEQGKDPKKLTAEELEKRVAPMGLTYTDPAEDAGEAPTGQKAPGVDAP